MQFITLIMSYTSSTSMYICVRSTVCTPAGAVVRFWIDLSSSTWNTIAQASSVNWSYHIIVEVQTWRSIQDLPLKQPLIFLESARVLIFRFDGFADASVHHQKLVETTGFSCILPIWDLCIKRYHLIILRFLGIRALVVARSNTYFSVFR